MSPWKACDIRGLYPDEVTADLLGGVAAGISAGLVERSRVLLAGDFRLSTRDLKTAVCQALIRAGMTVLDAGQLPTPVAYFAYRQLGADAILIVTASHNPAEYNGLKFMVGHVPPAETDLESLKGMTCEQFPAQDGGTVERIDPVPSYKNWIKERWSQQTRDSGLSVVLDAGNGAWSELAPDIFAALGFEVNTLFCQVDGRFPNRPPDSARSANLKALVEQVRQVHADLGIAWDGDGDRVAFVDSTGRVAFADEISMLLIEDLLRCRADEKVVVDIKLSDLLRKRIEQLNCIPILERSGHTFLKRRMILEHCLFGAEVSGHYFYRELGGGDDGLFTALLVASLLKRAGPLNELVQSLPRFYVTPDLRLQAVSQDYRRIVERLRKRLHAIREIEVDGLRLETSLGFVLVRRSVTEPVVTMRIEGHDEAALGRLITACCDALPEFTAEIEEQICTGPME